MEFRPRLSLLNLLLVVAIVALSITTARLWSEVGPLRQEVRRLRDEVGELSIVDPSRLHAIRVSTVDELEWTWRVWFPEGRTYRLHSVGEKVSVSGYPAGGGSTTFSSVGEHVVRYVIARDREGRWRGKLITPSGWVGTDFHAWVDADRRLSESTGVGELTRDFDPDEVVELVRYRTSGEVNSSSDIPDPSEGFQVWIEPL